MSWFIDFPVPESPFPISHQSKILSLGSCFAQTIGQKMETSKFDILINPFGTIFHPLNLADLLEMAVNENSPNLQGILERDQSFFHYQAHSDLRGKTKEELIDLFQFQLQKTKTYLSEGSHLILTLGTSWIYELDGYGPVANCHKQPQKLFRKRLTTIEEMEKGLVGILQKVLSLNPKLKIVLTVSPVRHIKDGIPENQLSKSLLRVLCSNLENQFESVSYFPAYEILMDELRDYRFYKSDRIHPSEEAENYIWEKWKKAIFDSETQEKVKEIEKINLELAHRPMNPDSDSYRKFLENLLAKLERLNGEFDFSREIQLIENRLHGSN
ncbi:GSCFA family protein [Algoriphagus boseongensis]|uniref:GSCFA family protein n=1 Tax=Algoriphagus boseongensis TaxID=1442587 RepID=A0A4R6TB88_9BACT|nr:GSCFA domain-containing protein [Algoriphagus boseongensis]TDQ19503.1 GSCFA family protein [Algoriphagus boseongensis]